MLPGSACCPRRSLERASGEIIDWTYDHDADQPGKIDSRDRPRQRSGVEINCQKGNLHRNAQQVARQRGEVVLAIDATVGGKEGRYMIVTEADQVIVDQVDRRPRYQQVEQQLVEVAVERQEMRDARKP